MFAQPMSDIGVLAWTIPGNGGKSYERFACLHNRRGVRRRTRRQDGDL
jgi:hypothetical protein